MYEPLFVDDVFVRTSQPAAAPRAHVWLIHGFGESGLCFDEAFASPLAEEFSLFAPDLPGFGTTQSPEGRAFGLTASADDVASLIAEVSAGHDVIFVGHSLGSVIAARAGQRVERLRGLFSIEGNLTPEDGFFSAKAKAYVGKAEEFHRLFIDGIRQKARTDPEYHRYLASLLLASPEALVAWGSEAADQDEEDTFGPELLALTCPTFYYWEEAGTSGSAQKFLVKHRIPNEVYTGAGHWPMVSIPDRCYAAIRHFAESCIGA